MSTSNNDTHAIIRVECVSEKYPSETDLEKVKKWQVPSYLHVHTPIYSLSHSGTLFLPFQSGFI